ncbi:DNA mismatch endonuclease Vsr [Blastococcus sp. DSM 46786]|uniref:DNA mismatch endonuclease Vsr n=1 Tax=Blastococcus sp. DSM 46786 TaxID=1798227 RepID=UPI000B8933CA|nr:DNA mismatch endonuclease Vsr [Blastococcus sp. DSM 46786]
MRVPPPPATNDAVRRRMRTTRRRDTDCEVGLRRILHSVGLRYRIHAKVKHLGNRRRVDLVFTAARVAVFVDGCFWHSCPSHGTLPKSNRAWWQDKLHANVLRDRDSDEILTNAGWVVVRVWEHEDPLAAAQLIVERLARIDERYLLNQRRIRQLGAAQRGR